MVEKNKHFFKELKETALRTDKKDLKACARFFENLKKNSELDPNAFKKVRALLIGDDKLNTELEEAVEQYNETYEKLNETGTELFIQRQRAADLLENVEYFVNSIANHDKQFDRDFGEITIDKEKFREACSFAKEELDAAKETAMKGGTGVAGGVATAAMAPTAAMWIATTFGTASTGVAISTLSGAAANAAALAWLGGGTLAAGGGGMAAGNALLALAGPVGWGIAGVTVLSTIIIFVKKKKTTEKEKKETIEKILKHSESLKEKTGAVDSLLQKTSILRVELNEQFQDCMKYCQTDFSEIPKENRMQLFALVNNAKALGALLSKTIEA